MGFGAAGLSCINWPGFYWLKEQDIVAVLLSGKVDDVARERKKAFWSRKGAERC